MPREIKTTLAVDGEAAFKRAINEANTSIRNLGTRLSLASAEFKKDGDAMKLMETRSKTLNAEIGQQEEIVKALEKAVKDSTTAYGENSTKTEKWQAELNRAKTKLTDLQTELALNESGLNKNGVAFDDSAQKAADYNATLQTVGRGVSFENVTTGIGKITSGFEGAIKKIAAFAKSMRQSMVDAGEWADDLMTQATQYGMDVETLQRWRNAADFIDTDVSTIINAQDKLGKKMTEGWTKGSGKEKIDMWEMLGIDLKDAETGAYRDKMDVMFELGETLMNMTKIDGNDARADEYAMEVFGKSWRELLPLFTAGQEEWEKTVADQKVVSEEHVKALGEMDDANKQLENSWETLKYSALSEIAPVLTEATNALSELLNEFNSWLDTEEGKKAMEELSEALKELFSGLGDIKFTDVINAAKDAVNGLKDALKWMADHKDDVVTALEGIGIGFGLLKVTELATNITKIAEGFKTLWSGANKPLPSLSSVGGGGGGGATGGAEAAAEGAAAGGATAWATKFAPLMSWLSQTGAKATSLFTSGGGLFPAIGDMFMNQTSAGRALRDGTDVVEGVVQDLKEKGEEIQHNAETFAEDWKEVAEKNPVVQTFKKAGEANKQAQEWVLDDDVTAEEAMAFVQQHTAPKEIEEDVDLDPEYTTEEMIEAIQDWWDARRNAENGTDSWDEESAAYHWMEEVLGDRFEEDFWDSFVKNSTGLDLSTMEDIPADWYPNLSGTLNDAVEEMKANTANTEKYTAAIAAADFKKFNGLPDEIRAATRQGTEEGMSGIVVKLDGTIVGNLLAPYINRALGLTIY